MQVPAIAENRELKEQLAEVEEHLEAVGKAGSEKPVKAD